MTTSFLSDSYFVVVSSLRVYFLFISGFITTSCSFAIYLLGAYLVSLVTFTSLFLSSPLA